MNAHHTSILRRLVLLTGMVFAAAAVAMGAPTAGRPRLVDLGADKCIPCKLMAPILEELRKEYAGRLDVEFIDVWKNRDAGVPYNIRVIPTQIFYDASGKERFRHEGFFSKHDILGKFSELGVNLGGGGRPVGIVREKPIAPDTRPADRKCYMCDGDVGARDRTVVKGQSEQRVLCSLHCYFIYESSVVGVDTQAAAAKVSVTDWSTGRLTAATTATYLYGMDDRGRPTIKAFAERSVAEKERASRPANLANWEVLRSKELAARCGFCDRAVYPEDACHVKVGAMRTYGCCTHCAMGVAARLQKDIEVEARDGHTEQPIKVTTLNGGVATLEPATAVAWFGQKKGQDGNWVSAGCFKQGFFANEENLRKWLEARPAMTGRQITIAQALADKMKLTPEQIAKACKLGECK